MRLSKVGIRNFRNFRSVDIPLSGNVDSLNVGAAAAIACYAITRA